MEAIIFLKRKSSFNLEESSFNLEELRNFQFSAFMPKGQKVPNFAQTSWYHQENI